MQVHTKAQAELFQNRVTEKGLASAEQCPRHDIVSPPTSDYFRMHIPGSRNRSAIMESLQRHWEMKAFNKLPGSASAMEVPDPLPLTTEVTHQWNDLGTISTLSL